MRSSSDASRIVTTLILSHKVRGDACQAVIELQNIPQPAVVTEHNCFNRFRLKERFVEYVVKAEYQTAEMMSHPSVLCLVPNK